MAYRSEPIPALDEWVHDEYKNVKFGFKLIEKIIRPEFKEDDVRKAIKEYELIVVAYVFPPRTTPPLKPDLDNPAIAFSEISVNYADVIKAYKPRKILGDLKSHVSDELLDSILARLNAPLALNIHQLGTDVIDTLYKNIEKFVPEEDLPSGTVTG